MDVRRAARRIVDELLGKRAVADDYTFVEGVINGVDGASSHILAGHKPMRATDAANNGITLFREGGKMGDTINLSSKDVESIVSDLIDMGRLDNIIVKNEHVARFLRKVIDDWEG